MLFVISLFTLGMASCQSDINYIKEEYQLANKDISYINLDVINRKINVYQSDDENFYINYFNSNLEKINVDINNDSIDISLINNNNGDIDLNNNNINESINLINKNGNIDGSIIGNQKEFKFSCEITKGNTNLPWLQEGGNKLLNINMNNGDVNINFLKN